MDQPSGSIQSRGPPASTWLNTMQRACGETLVTVCHCPDAHLQSPSGGKGSAGGGWWHCGGRMSMSLTYCQFRSPEGERHVWQSGSWCCGTSHKRSREAGLSFQDINTQKSSNPDFSRSRTALLTFFYKATLYPWITAFVFCRFTQKNTQIFISNWF